MDEHMGAVVSVLGSKWSPVFISLRKWRCCVFISCMLVLCFSSRSSLSLPPFLFAFISSPVWSRGNYSMTASFHSNEPTPVSYCLSISIPNQSICNTFFLLALNLPSFLPPPSASSFFPDHVLICINIFTVSLFPGVIAFDCPETSTVPLPSRQSEREAFCEGGHLLAGQINRFVEVCALLLFIGRCNCCMHGCLFIHWFVFT